VLACGSRAGIERLARGDAAVAAVHWRDAQSGEDNLPLIRATLAGADVVALEWARRTQGLLVAAGNPLRIRTLGDLAKKRPRIAMRQPDAGSHRLFEHLLAAAGLRYDELDRLPGVVRAETDLAAAIAAERAGAGFGIEAAARAHDLGFIALATERMDLVARRRDVFEPPLQALLGFARTSKFRAHAKALGGYDIAATGRVVFNS
jgi:molybdate-binding protein